MGLIRSSTGGRAEVVQHDWIAGPLLARRGRRPDSPEWVSGLYVTAIIGAVVGWEQSMTHRPADLSAPRRAPTTSAIASCTPPGGWLTGSASVPQWNGWTVWRRTAL
jgi:hypothetical protein